MGPLIAKRDKATGRVITLDKIDLNGKKVNRIAEPGERVPRHNQFLVPNPKRKGGLGNTLSVVLNNLVMKLSGKKYYCC